METGEIGKLVYMGHERIPEWKMIRFIGLPMSLFRNIFTRHERGEVPNLIAALLCPWSAILLHDRYLPFMEDVVDSVKTAVRKSKMLDDAELKMKSLTNISLEEHVMKEAGTTITELLNNFIKSDESMLANFAFPLAPNEQDPRAKASFFIKGNQFAKPKRFH
ncbi:hypothetical protein R1sor_027500 [Riccia sorocarpa]|uniref:CFAP61 dimerisation domain-containing protein n=1 Tax=Riccia sorocarpa TaxID=122646 RepID=A0ABD3GED0_9MARC